MNRNAATLASGVFLLLAVVLLAAGGTSPVELGTPAGLPGIELPTEPDEGAAGGSRPGDEGSEGRAGGVLLGVTLLVVALLALLGAVTLLTLRRQGRRSGAGATAVDPGQSPAGPDPVAVHDALRVARDELDLLRREGRPGDAVVAAWQRLEELAAGTAAARAAHHTPTEFAGLLRATPGVDAGAVEDLRRRYSRARFSSSRVTDADAAAADVALDRIAAALPRVTR